MKIAFFTDVLIPPAGGIEQHILAIARELAGRGHEVRVFAPGPFFGKIKNQKSPPKADPPLEEKIKIANQKSKILGDLSSDQLSIVNCQLLIVPSLPAGFIWPNFRLSFPLHLYFQLKKWRPDVVHFHTAGPTSLAGIILAKILKIKIVGTFHSYFMNPEYLGGKIQNSKIPSARASQGEGKNQNDNLKFKIDGSIIKTFSKILWRYATWFYNLADVVVTPTQFVADDLSRRGFKATPAIAPTVVSLTAFETPAPTDRVEGLKRQHNLTGPVLLYVGRISAEKSLDVLLKAVKICQLSLPAQAGIVNCQLLLVGDGPAVGELVKLSEALGIRQQVIFLGRINHEDLSQSGVYEASNLFVLPSTSETMSIVVLEAMTKGLPVIVPEKTAAAELLLNNGSTSLTTGGLTFRAGDEQDLGEKILRVIGDEAMKREMGKNSKKRAEDFSLQKTINKLERIYKDSY